VYCRRRMRRERRKEEEDKEGKAENVCKAHIVALYDNRYLNNERLFLHLQICMKVL
jgi:hypothetical protein